MVGLILLRVFDCVYFMCVCFRGCVRFFFCFLVLAGGVFLNPF